MKPGLCELPIETPITVLSDLHMAHPASYIDHPRQLLPLLKNCRTVIFNGDTCELSNLRRKADAVRLLTDLIAYCHELGIRPLFLTGNHDPLISNLHFLDLFGGRVFITHGDMLHPAIAPWSREATAILAERHRLLAGHDPPRTLEETVLVTKQSALVAALYDKGSHAGLRGRIELVSRFIAKPWRILITLLYWANVAHYCHAAQQRFRPKARLMLIGHTHRAGVWKNKDYMLVNTGSFQPLSKRLMVQLDGQRAVVRKIVRENGEYRPGRVISQTTIHE